MNAINTISGKSSAFELSEYRFVDTQISLDEGHLNGKLKTNFAVVAEKNEEFRFKTKIIVTVSNEDKSFSIKASIVGLFNVKDSNVKDIKRLMNIDAVIYLYPYMRAYLSALTSLSNIAPFDLPIIEESFFKEQFEKNEAKKKKNS